MDQRIAQLLPFAVSLALGALVGIEREHSGPGSFPGGVRTFPLIALLGCVAAWLGSIMGTVAFAVIAAGFVALVVAGQVVSSLKGPTGATTALASLLTFLFGVMAQRDEALLAAALAVSTTAILSLRRPLHELTSKIVEADLYAALELAALTVIVLPLLPDRDYGAPPFDMLNPFRLWLIVVLVAALGFLGYVGVKVLGPGRGVVVAGTLGGLVSSTAATYSLASRSRESPDLSRALALGICLAWATMCARVLVEIAVVDPALVRLALPSVLAAMLAAFAGAGLLHLVSRRAASHPAIPFKNPFSVWSAVRFGAIFTAVLFLAKLAQIAWKDAGLLLAAGLSGSAQVDAATITLAKLAHNGEVAPRVAVLGIATAIGANTIVKTILALSLGAPVLRRALLPTILGTLIVGGVTLYLTLPA